MQNQASGRQNKAMMPVRGQRIFKKPDAKAKSSASSAALSAGVRNQIPIKLAVSALFRGYGSKRSNQLMDPLAAAMRTGDAALFDIRHMKGLGEFLIAVLAMKDVLRHGPPPET